MLKHLSVRRAFVLALAAASSLVVAAPIDSHEVAPAAVPGQAVTPGSPGVARPAVVGASHPSTTVELLLQLQDQAGAASAATAASAVRVDSMPRRPSVADLPAAPEPSVLDDMLSGAGRLKAAVLGDREPNQAQPSRIDADDGVQTRGGAAEMPARARPADPVQASGSSFLNNPAIRFIRENRDLTIVVCVGLVAALWLATMWPAWQRQRETRRRNR